MRLDKYLKVSRIIKRRTVANEACSGGRVTLNGKVAKPGADVKVGDQMTIRFGDRYGKYEILSVAEVVRKELGKTLGIIRANAIKKANAVVHSSVKS